jgi:5-methylcytosine-specific restriction endonuclease McrA
MAVKQRAIRGEVCSKTKHPRNSNDVIRTSNKHYQDLVDERWRSKRATIVAQANFKCVECGAGDCRLEVHHLYYVKGKRLWEYPEKALKSLCSACHKEWHQNHRLEYREEIWSKNEEYQPPKKRKIYFVTKGKFSVRKEEPYKKPKKQNNRVKLTLHDKSRIAINKKVKAGKLKFSFAPIPEWRLQQKQITGS